MDLLYITVYSLYTLDIENAYLPVNLGHVRLRRVTRTLTSIGLSLDLDDPVQHVRFRTIDSEDIS